MVGLIGAFWERLGIFGRKAVIGLLYAVDTFYDSQ
jgi:hypothetical protein